MNFRAMTLGVILAVAVSVSAQAGVLNFSFASATGTPITFEYDAGTGDLTAADDIRFEVSIDGILKSYDATLSFEASENLVPDTFDSVTFKITDDSGDLLTGTFENAGLLTAPTLGIGGFGAGNDAAMGMTLAYSIGGDLLADVEAIIAPSPAVDVVLDNADADLAFAFSNLEVAPDESWTAFASYTGNTKGIPEPATVSLIALGATLMLSRRR